MSLTNATAADEISVSKDPQVILKKGAASPFTGVLVPYEIFKAYQVNDFETNILRQRADVCERTMEEIKPEPAVIQPLWFIGGFILGTLAMNKLR